MRTKFIPILLGDEFITVEAQFVRSHPQRQATPTGELICPCCNGTVKPNYDLIQHQFYGSDRTWTIFACFRCWFAIVFVYDLESESENAESTL